MRRALYDASNPHAYRLDDADPLVLLDPFIGRHLRPHQVEGVRFLYRSVARPGASGCVLADEMGLGKTVQTIALVWTLYKQRQCKKTVVVCPQSLLGNWQREFAKWLGRERMEVRACASDATLAQQVKDFAISYVPVLIISYEQVRQHAATLRTVPLGLLVCDEGHRIKNLASKTGAALLSLKCTKHVVLSGTPMQNSLDEFYSLVEFCAPGWLGAAATFRRVFAAPIERAQEADASPEQVALGRERARELSEKLAGVVLRRTAQVNERYLPDKTELVLFVRASPLQAELYRAILDRLDVDELRMCVALQTMQTLTKLCNHPALLAPWIATCADELPDAAHTVAAAEHVVAEWSGKFRTVVALLARILATTPERVVVVSNYTTTLDLFEKYFAEHPECGAKHLRLDGGTSQQQRQFVVDRINDPTAAYNVLLLSSKAGGVGLNLIGASRLVLFDPDWNPAVDKQAMARSLWRCTVVLTRSLEGRPGAPRGDLSLLRCRDHRREDLPAAVAEEPNQPEHCRGVP